MQDSHRNCLACGDTVLFYNQDTDTIEKGKIIYIHDDNTCAIKYHLTRESKAYDYNGENCRDIYSVPENHIILLNSIYGTPMIG